MKDPYGLFLTRFSDFTEIQKRAFPEIEKGSNCLISAPTGSGKTEAAMLPTLKLAANGSGAGIVAIYITPLRALNRDLIGRLRWLCGELEVSIGVRHGDTPQSERRKQSERPPQILITTPESLQNILISPKLRNALKNIRCVIVDEVHELYYNKRGAQLAVALERLVEVSGEFQRIGLSATIGDVGEASHLVFGARERKLIQSDRRKQLKITVKMPERAGKGGKELKERFALDEHSAARITSVADEIRDSEAALVFANTRQVVESLGNKLLYLNKIEDFGGIGVHHSSIDKEERVQVENAFKAKQIKSIIATSSLELGIDVGRVNLVVQYGSPRQCTRLLQRIGRSGHTELGVSNGTVIAPSFIECFEALAVIEAVGRGFLEKRRVERLAADVMVNQICALALEYRKIPRSKAFEIFSRAGPYIGIERAFYERALQLASDLRLVRVDEKEISLGARSRDCFFQNISLIPDTRKIHVKMLESNKLLSSLDEEFVFNNVDEGSVFITKGLPWKVISIEQETIYVEQSNEIEAAVPDWEGEDMPVSSFVSGLVFEMLGSPSMLEGMNCLDQSLLSRAKDFAKRQSAYFTPSAKSIVIEDFDGYTVVHVALGKLANDFLGRVISLLASSEYSTRINFRSTPYVIVLEYKDSFRRPDFAKILARVGKVGKENYAKFVEGSELFRYRFVQVARALGILDKKSTVSKGTVDRLMSFYKGSLLFDEVMRDLEKNSMDRVAFDKFADEMSRGAIEISELGRNGSPLSEEAIKAAYMSREVAFDVAPSVGQIESAIQKVVGKEVMLLCTFCGASFTRKIASDDKQITCIVCKSPLVVRYSDDYNRIISKVKKEKKLDSAENKKHDEMTKEAGLVSAYGDRALMALATYGVGLDTATRILKYVRKDYSSFFVDVLEAQKNFVKNRKFWKAR